MREISIGAWFAMSSLLAAACGGSQFTSENDAPNGDGSGSKSSGNAGEERAGSPSPSGGRAAGGAGPVGSGGSVAAGAPTRGGGNAAGSPAEGGGSGSESCVEGVVRFRVLPSPDLPKDYLCDAGCGTGWLTVTDPDGATAFSVFSACGVARCDSCELDPCAAAACLPTPLTAEGNDVLWDGSHLTQGTCGSNMVCQRRACVPPGRYKAKACAAVSTGQADMSGACQPRDEQLCVEAEFDFPTADTVKLVLEKL